jgi:hypothetical protein
MKSLSGVGQGSPKPMRSHRTDAAGSPPVRNNLKFLRKLPVVQNTANLQQNSSSGRLSSDRSAAATPSPRRSTQQAVRKSGVPGNDGEFASQQSQEGY